ncbi:MAG: efflux RND transporter periplasmic adaptor subunit [Candidatus Eisenbacteria sp.]|nr:efflux RND transporter periplasmic adaptor subunit [Candidatus Eisenbacteria bacterium]
MSRMLIFSWRRDRSWHWLRTAGFIFAVLLIAGCSPPEPTNDEQAAPPPVEVIALHPCSLRETTVLTGVLDAYRAVDVVSEVSGKITHIHVDIGDRATAGGRLASIDKQVSQETYNQAAAAMIAAVARAHVAREDFVRDSTLHAGGDISQAAFDASSMARTTARADLQGARAARALAHRNLTEAEIRAPFAGYVSRRHCEVGTFVSLGMPLFRIVEIDSLRLLISVSQRNIGRIRPGSEVLMRVEAFPGEQFRGRIRSISPEADELTRTFPVEVILPNPPGAPLRDGLVARATLVLATHENALSVPREAVLRNGMGAYVYVISDSTAYRRPIRIGAQIKNRVVIEAGPAAGDTVAVIGVQNLRDSLRVRIEAAMPSLPAEEDR